MPYIAMNNFQVSADQTEQFEERWRKRRSFLQDVPGFKHFQLLRGDEQEGLVHYVSHSTWASKTLLLTGHTRIVLCKPTGESPFQRGCSRGTRS